MLLENKCRTCYRDVTTGESYVLTPPGDSQTSLNLASKLKDCVPEIELDEMHEEKICWTCCVTLDKTYEFRMTCLQTNEKFVNTDNLHTDIDVVKTEIVDIKQEFENDVMVDERPFEVDEEEEEVIKGDISVGFEITKAKDVHNTVSVSITTSGTEIKTFNKKKLKVIEDVHEIKTDGVANKEVQQSEFKDDPVDGLVTGDADKINCNLEVRPLANQVSKALEYKRSVYVCTFCDAIFATRITWKKHTNRHKRKRHQETKLRVKNDEPKKKFEAKTKSKVGDEKSGFSLKNEPVTRSKSLGIAESNLPAEPQEILKRPNTRNMSRKIEAIANKRKRSESAEPKVKVDTANPPEIACVFCKINFHSANIYKIHMKFIHRIDVANVESSKQDDAVKTRSKINAEDKSPKARDSKQPAIGRKYHCSFCGNVLFSPQGFAGHCARHGNHKKCKFCAKNFTHMKQYLDHRLSCVKEAVNKTKDVRKSAAVSNVDKKNIRKIADSDVSTKTNLKHKVMTRSSKSNEAKETRLNRPKRSKTDVHKSAEAEEPVNHVVRTRSRSRYSTLNHIESIIGFCPFTNTSGSEEHKSKTNVTVNQLDDKANAPTVTEINEHKSNVTDPLEVDKVREERVGQSSPLAKPEQAKDKTSLIETRDCMENCTGSKLEFGGTSAEVPIAEERKKIEPKTDSNSNVCCTKSVLDSGELGPKDQSSDDETHGNDENSTDGHRPRKDREIASEVNTESIDLNKICEFCLLSFETADCLKAHVCLGMSMELDQMYRCVVCQTLFVGQETFITHTKTAHS